MKFWPFILLLLAGCATAVSPIATVPPPHTKRTQSVIAPRVYHRSVSWDYFEPMPADNVAFDVEGSTNLLDWYRLTTTNQPPARFDSMNATELIRVGAHWILATNF